MTAFLPTGCALLGLVAGRLLDPVGRGTGTAGRFPAAELVTAGVCAALAVRLGPDPALPAFLYLGAVGVALARVDLRAHRLPNAVTLPSYGVGAVLFAGAALAEGTSAPLFRALLGMVALFGSYFLLAFLYPAGMGFGDVKLAGIVGLYLGWLGWDTWAVGAMTAFLAAGLTGVALLASGRIGLKSAIPFGPFMLAGCLLGVLAGGPVAAYAGGLG